MKFSRSIVLMFIAFFLLQSCTDLKKGEQLSQLESITKTIDSIEVVLNENRMDSLKEMYDKTKIIDQQLNDFHASDTLDLAFALTLDEYKLMAQSIPEIEMCQLNLEKGIKELRASITKLEHDIENASGEKNRYDEFIQFEKDKKKKLIIILNNFSAMHDKIVKDFDTVENQVKIFLGGGKLL